MKRLGRKGEWNEYVEFSYDGSVRFVAQKSRNNYWYIYYLSKKTLITLDSTKSKREAIRLAQIAAKVYFDICD